MNSRERLLASINHKEPDRVPVDLGSTPSSGISAIAYNRLKQMLKINTGHTRVYDVVQQLAQPEDEILDRFKIDMIDLGRIFNTENIDWHDIKLPDGSTAQYPVWFNPVKQLDGSFIAYLKDGSPAGKMPMGATFFDQMIFPYIDGYPENYKSLPADISKVHWAALAHSPWDHAADPGFWVQLREEALRLRKTSNRAIVLVIGCNLFEWGTFLRRIDNFLMDIYTEQDKVEAFLDAMMEIHMANLEKACAAVGDLVDVIRFGDDLGMDSGGFIPPAVYRKLFKPRHRMLCEYVKRHGSMHTFLHSCGSIYELLPDLIEAGFEIFNPVQTSSRNMDPVKIKKEFGQDIVIWGAGADTRSILNRGTIEQVKNDVKRRLEILAPGGGFVFNTIHNIMPDVPPENIVAMFEAIDEFYW